MDPFTLAMGAVGLATSIAGGVVGGVNSAKQQRAAQEQQEKRDAFNNAMFQRQYYQDALYRNDTQNMLRRLRNEMRDTSETQRNTAVVTGQTPEAVAATKAANAKAYADTVAEIDATNATRRDEALQQYQAIQNGSYADWINMHQHAANNWNNLMSQAFATGAGSLNTIAEGVGGTGTTNVATTAGTTNVATPEFGKLKIEDIHDDSVYQYT